MINLSEKYPNYFNKKILRITLLICLIFVVALLVINKGDFRNVYVECNNEGGCLNPFYNCNEFGKMCQKSSLCKDNPELCESVNIRYGEIIGNKNFLMQNNNTICFLIILIGFLINHIYYKVKYGRKNNN